MCCWKQDLMLMLGVNLTIRWGGRLTSTDMQNGKHVKTVKKTKKANMGRFHHPWIAF